MGALRSYLKTNVWQKGGELKIIKNIIIGIGAFLVLAIGGYLLLSNAFNSQKIVDEEASVTEKETVESDDMVAKDVVEFTIQGSPGKLDPSTLRVKQGQKVNITFQNVGGTHDFGIEGYNVKTKVLASGASETLEFVADKTGEFPFFCSVPGHREAGMEGLLIVE